MLSATRMFAILRKKHCRTVSAGWAAILALLFAALLVGCSKAGKESAEKKTAPAAGRGGGESAEALLIKPPAAEFQQPLNLPAGQPLPRMTPEGEQPSSPQESPQAASSPAPPKVRPGKKAAVPFDPIKENGPIFVDWPKPKLAIVITGMEHGYLEPCGCAGLDRMRGGMGRRHSLFLQLRREGWPVFGIDVGGLARGFGRQAELKFHTLVESKRRMGYAAVAFGVDDLRLPAGELAAVAAGVNGQESLFVAANVGLFGFQAGITPRYRIIEAGGMKIGVTAVLGTSYQKEIHNDELEMMDAEGALRQILPELKQKADYLILLAHAPREEALSLARKFPDFQVVVTPDGPPLPPAQPETIDGSERLLITVGEKGMEAIVLAFFDDAQQPWRYQRVPLDSRFPSSPEMQLLMVVYQEQLKAMGLSGLGLRPVPHPLLESNGKFVGSQKCESCHEESYKVWRKSGHAQAYESLVKAEPPRNFDPECLSCHVVGWHPTKYFPYESGYESLEKTPHLSDVGCESCHGPGEKHCAVESGSNEALQKKYRQAMVLTKEDARQQHCGTCHDLDNSPDFDFDAYWPLVEHKEDTE